MGGFLDDGRARCPQPPAGQSSPDLEFAFPSYTVGAQEQTFRIIIKPDLWESETRLRLTNLFGTQPVTFGSVTVAWQSSPETSVTFPQARSFIATPSNWWRLPKEVIRCR